MSNVAASLLIEPKPVMKLSPISFFVFTLCATVPVFAQDEAYAGGATSGTRLETRLSGLEEQMRNLNGRLEQIEYAERRLEQTLQRMQSDADMRLTKLESIPAPAAPPPPPAALVVPPSAGAVPSTPTQPAGEINGTLGAIKMQNGKVVGGVNAPQAPALPVAPPDYGLTTQEQYERAFNMLRQANYVEAEEAFKNFIDKNPKDKLIDNAKYWYGETLYARAQYDESAVAFADAYQQNTRGTKAPDSLLKLAMSLESLNKTQDACVTLGELKSKYPNASTTIKNRAQEERVKMKCPTH